MLTRHGKQAGRQKGGQRRFQGSDHLLVVSMMMTGCVSFVRTCWRTTATAGRT